MYAERCAYGKISKRSSQRRQSGRVCPLFLVFGEGRLGISSHRECFILRLARYPVIPGTCCTVCTVYDGVYDTPQRRFSKLNCATTKRVRITNDISSEGSLRDVSKAGLLGTDTIPTVEISTTENRPNGVWYAPSYTKSFVSYRNPTLKSRIARE